MHLPWRRARGLYFNMQSLVKKKNGIILLFTRQENAEYRAGLSIATDCYRVLFGKVGQTKHRVP